MNGLLESRGRPTVRDVAQRAGVATGSVSRVLAGAPNVLPRTRARVLNAVSELGYRLDERGRALRAGRGNLLLVLVPFFTRNLYQEILRGIDRAVAPDSGHLLLAVNVETPEEKLRAFDFMATDRRLAGILSVCLTPPEDFAALTGTPPTVLIDVQDDRFPSVLVDHVYGGYLGTRHLLKLGHTRIAFVGRPQDPFIRRGSSGPRVSGYRRALEEAGVEFRLEYFRPGEYSRADGFEQASALLDLAEPPTAIFAASDLQAIGVLEATRARGLRVPQDLAVLGYNDIELAEYLGLSTVRLPIDELVDGAMKLLQAAWSSETLSPPAPLLPSLVIRATCGGDASTTTPQIQIEP